MFDMASNDHAADSDFLGLELRAGWRDALEDLEYEGRLHPRAAAAPSMPFVFARMLERALAASEGNERETLVHYHTRTLQQMRAAVVASNQEPQRTLLHTPLELARMPRFTTALDAFFALVGAAGVDPRMAFGAADAPELLRARPTIAALFMGAHYGSYGPPLYLGPNDLASLGRELAQGESALQVIDRRLPGPIVHELSHFGRARMPLVSPYLDECVSAYLGALAFPSLAVPDADDDAAMYGATWFTQVGAHLARIIGRGALIRAHVGVAAWSEVLPAGLLPTLERLAWDQWLAGRQLSFLGDTDQPDLWIKAFWLAAAGELAADVSLADLVRYPWSELPREPWGEADTALLAWGREALGTAPSLTPEGAWRVSAQPVETTIDGHGRIRRVGVSYPLEHTAMYVVAPPGAPAVCA